jgi:hypothetical protein
MCRALDPENQVAQSEPSVFAFELEQNSVSTTKQSIFRDTPLRRHLHPNAGRQQMPRAINELELWASAPKPLPTPARGRLRVIDTCIRYRLHQFNDNLNISEAGMNRT